MRKNLSEDIDQHLSALSALVSGQLPPTGDVQPARVVGRRRSGTSSSRATDGATTARPEPLVGTPPRVVTPPGLRMNPVGWRWRLAKFLIGGKFEAVALFPLRPIYPRSDVLLVRMGEEGATNTVEVSLPDMSITPELLPIDDVRDVYPGTFIAVDVKLLKEAEPHRFVGTFVGWQGTTFVLQAVDAGDNINIDKKAIKGVWYAPAGYRV